MFERFSKGAQQVVLDAHLEGRRLGNDHIGTKHLLLALTMSKDDAARVLAEAGITTEVVEAELARQDLGEEDAEALGALGIDLDEVTRTVEATFGEGALSRPPTFNRNKVPFTGGARKVLELSLREAIHLGHKQIGSEHIFLGLLRNDKGSAHGWLIARGCDLDGIRESLLERLRRAS